MLITIDFPRRGQDLPPSLPFRKETPVTVSIQDYSGNLDQAISFIVVNNSEFNGSASIVGANELSKDGVIRVRGDAQTMPTYSGKLVIQALYKSKVVCSSNGFSVCSHPICVENGPRYEPITLTHDESDGSSVGLKVWIQLQSDSGNPADMSAVYEKEVVADARHFTGALNSGPTSSNSSWQLATRVEPDRHLIRADVMNMIDQEQLNGRAGGMSNDQLDVFYCERCGMSEKMQTVIPNSGYRVTRVFSTVSNNQLQLVLQKQPQAVEINHFKVDAGPSSPIHIETTVPKTHVDVAPSNK